MPQTERGPIGGVLSLRQFLNPVLDMLCLGSSWNTEAQGKGGKRLGLITKKYRPRNEYLKRETLQGKEQRTEILRMTTFKENRKKRL